MSCGLCAAKETRGTAWSRQRSRTCDEVVVSLSLGWGLDVSNRGEEIVARLAEPADPDRGAGFVAPRTPLEQGIAAIWREVLGSVRIGVDENFFHRGGYSLAAARLVARIRDEYGVDIPLWRFCAAATIEKLAEMVRKAVAKQSEEKAGMTGAGSTDVQLIKQTPEEILAKLGGLTEGELDVLLEKYRREAEVGVATIETAVAHAGDRGAVDDIGAEADVEKLLDRLDELSDEQVASLLSGFLAAEGE